MTPRTEGKLAWRWRVAAGHTRRSLAAATGYAERTIYAIETGRWPNGNDIGADTRLAYRLACGAIAARLEFDWISLRSHQWPPTPDPLHWDELAIQGTAAPAHPR